MSKNKDIEALHQWTGKPYRECRAIMKANGWDLCRAIGLADFPERIITFLDDFSEALGRMTTLLKETMESIDWAQVIELIKKAKEEEQK